MAPRDVTENRWRYVIAHAALPTWRSTVRVITPDGEVLHEQGAPNMTGAVTACSFESGRPDLNVQIAY